VNAGNWDEKNIDMHAFVYLDRMFVTFEENVLDFLLLGTYPGSSWGIILSAAKEGTKADTCRI